MASGQEILQAGLSAMQEHGIGLGILPGTNIGHVVEDIIAAVAPLIAAAEREKIACSLIAAAAVVAGKEFLPGIGPDERKQAIIVANVMIRQAAAIRTRSDAP